MTSAPRALTVRLHHPAPVVFDYLADPRTRPQWQSSLRRVEPLTDQVTGVGARWRDVTWTGVRPVMEVVTHDPPVAWAEQGRWRGLSASLSLVLVAVGEETDVRVSVSLDGAGAWRLAAQAAGRLAPAALRSDLRRVDRLLAERRG